MELMIWGSGWGLPSIDPESIQSLAAVRFSGISEVKVTESNNPWASPSGTIPFFKSGGTTLYSAHEIGIYLRSKNFSGDYGLTSIQCAETVAYCQLILDTLQVAYQYYCWIHEENFSKVIRPFYGRRLPWAYKLWYPERLRNQATDLISSMYQNSGNLSESLEVFILQKARNCIQLLTEKLGSKDFFMGTTAPTTLDGIVFSYLAIFWKVQLPHNPLKDSIAASPQLERYLTRIHQRYFPTSRAIDGITYGADGELIPPGDSSISSYHKFFFGFLVGGAMLSYALINRLIKIPRISPSRHHEDEDNEWE